MSLIVAARLGEERQVGLVVARYGIARSGLTRQEWPDLARQFEAGLGKARLGW